jgi:hypothetical protein
MEGSGMGGGRGAGMFTVVLLVSMGGFALAQQPAPPPAPAEGAAPAGSAPAPAAATPAATPSDPAAAPSSAGTPAAGSATPPAKTGEEAYELKIKTLEERVNELKERIFRSKQRLAQLQESVVGGATSSAKARILHKSEMGDVYRLKEIHYFMDGAPLRQEVDTSGDGLQLKNEEQLFDGALPPGNHQLTVNMVFQGSGYGMFSYLDGYQFKIRSSHTFTAEEGKQITVKVVAYEQGNATTELRDRPTVRYDMNIEPLVRKVDSNAGGIQATGGAQ